MDDQKLRSTLSRLKMTAIRDRLDTLLDGAARKELSMRETIAYLCEEEIRHKEERRVRMGMSLAKFPFVRTLEQFEFEAQNSIDPKQIRELSLCRWIANGNTLLLLGAPGVGKTHLAVALGREAIGLGYTVLFISAAALLTQLVKAHAGGKLEEQITHFSKPKLLIVDELGYLPFDPKAAHLFFQLVSKKI